MRWPPTASGLRKLLKRIDVAAFENALSQWIAAVLPGPATPLEKVAAALDGKSLRGTWDHLHGAVHLLSLIDHRTRCVLHQRQVPGSTNEHKTALAMLSDLVIRGKIITADAAFCQQDFCETVVAGGGDYVLPVKENQPLLRAAIETEFAARDAAFSPLHSA